MDDVQEALPEIRKKLKEIEYPGDIIENYVLSFLKIPNVIYHYPTLSVLLFDKNNSITSEDRFPNSFVVDFRFQWIESTKKQTDTFFAATGNIDDIHYCQVHLYLYFTSKRLHNPSKLYTFEFTNQNVEETLKKVKDFTLSLKEKTENSPYLGFTLAYTSAI